GARLAPLFFKGNRAMLKPMALSAVRDKRTLGAALLLLAASQMSGCVNHTWAPGPGAALPFGQASGQCKMAALDSHQGFVAIGNSNYVAGAAIGNGIGNAVRANATYNACMEAQG